MLFLTEKHLLDIFFRGPEISVRIACFFAFTDGALGQPPGGVCSQAMLLLQPISARLFGGRTFLFDEPDPFLKCASRFLFEFPDPSLSHQDARMNAINRF